MVNTGRPRKSVISEISDIGGEKKTFLANQFFYNLSCGITILVEDQL
jgi:hypothetical protein